MCRRRCGSDKVILWLCVGSECAASTSVERSRGLRVSMRTGSWFSLKNHKTSVKMLLAEFPSQAVQERPALLTNRKPMPPLKVWPEL